MKRYFERRTSLDAIADKTKQCKMSTLVDECCSKHKINTNTMTTKMTMTNTIQYNDKHKLVSVALLALNVMFVCGDSITVNGM